MTDTAAVHGYTYDASLPASPVSLSDLGDLEASVLLTDDDKRALRAAGAILVPQTEEILDVWYGFVGANAHLVSTFAGSDGEPSADYLEKVRGRFGQWIRDLCERDFDQRWLDYQHEIAVRHTSGKNRTDAVDSPSAYVPLRHLIALIVPITVTIRPFLQNGESDSEKVEAMYNAWFKAVTLTVALWSQSYAPDLW